MVGLETQGPLPTPALGDLEEGPLGHGSPAAHPAPSAGLWSPEPGAERTAWEPVCQPV